MMANTILQNLLCMGLVASIAMPYAPQIALAQEDDIPPPSEGAPIDMPPPPPAPMDIPQDQPVDDGPSTTTSAPIGNRVEKTGPATAKVVIDEKRGAEAVPAGQELVNMDFPEPTEIKDIIRAVALWTGKNVILDRNVSGKIQIISPKRVTKEEAYQAFLSALNVLQMTTVETGKIIKIMPIRTAVKGNLRTFLGSKWTPLTDEIITQIVPLKYVDAKSIQNTLSRIVSPNSMVAYDKTNTLIISDSGYKVRRILDILELIDVQGQQPQVAFVPIRYADAKSISDRVSEILKANSSGGGSYGAFKLMTDERSNSVIVFGPPRTIADVQGLVRKFDIELDDPSRQSSIHVRPLDYADAKKIASTLSSLAQGNKKRTPGSPLMNFSGSSSLSGAPGARTPDTGPVTADLDENLKITADESSNSLLITGSRAAYQAVNSIIRKLDIRRSQVYVEADILDLSSNNGFNFGTAILGGAKAGQNPLLTTWQGKDMAGLVGAQAAQNQNPGSAINPTDAAKAVSTFAADDMTIGILSNQKVTIPGVGTFSPGALIKMIKTDSNTRVLSSPHIMTANNEDAKIAVGEKVFFRSSETNATTGAVLPKAESETGELSLTLKPNISNSNYVTLKVEIDASTVVLDDVSQLPKVKKRKTSQVMTVKNGQTIVVSGLVETGQQESFKKIPLLGDIPILGWLFRNSQIKNTTNNMMIFLTPHIIHGADDLAAIYKAKVKERDEYLEYVYGSSYKDDRFYAQLPQDADGVYRADASDEDEKRRRDAVLKTMLEDEGQPQSVDPGVKESHKSDMTTPIPVPMNATLGGYNGGGGSSGGGGDMAPLPQQMPPPGGLQAPLPLHDGGGGGGDYSEPPPPMDSGPMIE